MLVYIVEATKTDKTSYIEAVFAYRHEAEVYVDENDSEQVRLEIVEERLRGF